MEKKAKELVVIKELIAIRMALRNLMKMDDFFWKSENPEIKAKNLLLGKCPNCKTGNLEAIRSFKTKKRLHSMHKLPKQLQDFFTTPSAWYHKDYLKSVRCLRMAEDCNHVLLEGLQRRKLARIMSASRETLF